MRAVWEREIRAYFSNVTGWIVLAAFLLMFNLYFYVYCMNYGYAYISYPLSGVTFVFLIVVPILTMRILSEDRKLRTDQLTMTSPQPLVAVVFGKFMSMVSVFSIVMGIVCLCPLFLSLFGTVPMKESYLAILGTWLFGVLSIAVGLFVSSLTENQVIAAILTFAFLFLGYMMDSICNLISSGGNWLTSILGCLSTTSYLDNFYSGVLDLNGVVYYISASALFLFLTCQVLQKFRWSTSVKKIKSGVYSSSLIILGIAIVIAVNLISSRMPSSVMSRDFTYNNVYSLTDETKDYLKNLDSDVTIYVLSTKSECDQTLKTTLDMYEDSSSKVKVEYVDPVVSPQFYSQYTDTQPTQNSMIVVCSDRSKVVDFSNIYESSLNSESYSYETTGYDGEGQLTSAIQYVTSEELPEVYMITGHGEGSLDSSFQDALEKQNVTLKDVNLLEVDSISSDVSGIIINAPSSDFSSDDAKKVIDYLNGGGKALIITNYAAESDMSNFDSILASYDMRAEKGVVMESSRQNYYQYPFYLLPQIQSADETDSIDGYVFVPDAQAISDLNTDEDNKLEWTALLKTSDNAYIKEDVQKMQSFEKESGDEEGSFTLAANVTDSETGAEVTVVGSPFIFTNDMDSMVSGNNLQLFTNITKIFNSDQEDSVSIPVKSYTVSNLTIPSSISVVCSVLLVIVLPALLIATGVIIWIRRRRL